MKYNIRKILMMILALALLISMSPAAFAAQKNPVATQRNYSEIFIGFTAVKTYVYKNPDEFSASIALPKGFPVYVVGEINDFFIVRNADGLKGYMLRHEVSTVMPSGAKPFYKTYNPKWEVQHYGKSSLLMLPNGMRIHSRPNADSAYMELTKNTPCRVIGKSGSYYIISNMSGSVVAYFHPQGLTDAVNVFRGWTA